MQVTIHAGHRPADRYAPDRSSQRFHARAKDLNGHPWCVQTGKITELVDAFGGLPK